MFMGHTINLGNCEFDERVVDGGAGEDGKWRGRENGGAVNELAIILLLGSSYLCFFRFWSSYLYFYLKLKFTRRESMYYYLLFFL